MNARRSAPAVATALMFALAGGGGGLAGQADTVEVQAPMESLPLDDEDVFDWYNGSPAETTIADSDRFVKQGRRALRFANVVDHTQGEKDYPVGWPRTGKDMSKEGLSDWTAYDFFECWIYAESSRPALPKTPLSVGFYHGGPKRSTSLPLAEVRQNQWTRIVIPVSQLSQPDDVKRVQFNISESDYEHGDHVDFYIDDLQLTRFAHPVIAELRAGRQILFANEHSFSAQYRLMGYRGDDKVHVELSVGIGQSGRALAVATHPAQAAGEVDLAVDRWPEPGVYRATLRLVSEAGESLGGREVTFRVVIGPFPDAE